MSRKHAQARERGRRGEERVAEALVARGWKILGRNVRVGRDELDIVAMDGSVLVAVEVRTRASDAFAHPSESIRGAKAARLRRAVQQLGVRFEHDELRIDVATVTGEAIDLIENAIDFTST